MRNAIFMTLMIASAQIASVACGRNTFSGATVSKGATAESTKSAAISNLTALEQIDNKCIAKEESATFSCENIAQSKGGLRDVVVGVKVVLLSIPANLENGLASCKAHGGELLATGDFFVDAIYDCIYSTGHPHWVEKESASVYKNKSMANIEAKYGSQIRDQCFKNQKNLGLSLIDSTPANKPGLSSIKKGRPQDPKTLNQIICVFRL